MHIRFPFTAALAGVLLLTGCKKEKTGNLNCEKIRSALLANNAEAVRKEIDTYTAFLRPDPAASDLYGQRLNIEKLVQDLNRECNLSATMGCYNCIFTLPPQTEIYVTVRDGGTPVRKVIDLSYTDSKRLVFAGLHD